MPGHENARSHSRARSLAGELDASLAALEAIRGQVTAPVPECPRTQLLLARRCLPALIASCRAVQEGCTRLAAFQAALQSNAADLARSRARLGVELQGLKALAREARESALRAEAANPPARLVLALQLGGGEPDRGPLLVGLDTLQMQAGSLLEETFRRPRELRRGAGGSIYLDRDPEAFRAAVNCLRAGRRLDLSGLDSEKRDRFEAELEHWGLFRGVEPPVPARRDPGPREPEEEKRQADQPVAPIDRISRVPAAGVGVPPGLLRYFGKAPTKSDFKYLDTSKNCFKNYSPMNQANWATMKRLDPTNFAKLTDAPMVKDDDWQWYQKDDNGRFGQMGRFVDDSFIWEWYIGGSFPSYCRMFTNVCRFEGVLNEDDTYTGEVVYYGSNQTLKGNFEQDWRDGELQFDLVNSKVLRLLKRRD